MSMLIRYVLLAIHPADGSRSGQDGPELRKDLSSRKVDNYGTVVSKVS